MSNIKITKTRSKNKNNKKRIKTIQSSLAIEGNILNLENVTALVENHRVLGPQKDIIEVQNTIKHMMN